MQSRYVLDTLVEEAVELGAMLLSLHSQPVLIIAAGAGALAGGWMSAYGPTVCIASAVASGGSVLWYNHLRIVRSLAIGNTAPQCSPNKGQILLRKALPAIMDDLD